LEGGVKVLSVSSTYDLSQPETRLVSHSRMTAASCPYRYYQEYVDPNKPKKSFESIELGLGKFFHGYVENHFKEILATGGTIDGKSRGLIDTQDLVNNFRLSFIWQGKLRDPYRVCRRNSTIEDFVSRLKCIGDNFNVFLRRLDGHQVEAVEGSLQIRSEDIHVRGKHDLVTRDPAGRLILWDWKTGRMPNAEYWEDFRDQKIQLAFYAIWMRHKHDAPNVTGAAVFLRDRADALMVESYSPRLETDALENATSWRRKVNARTAYPAITSPLCDWCGWNPVCPSCGGRRQAQPVRATPQPASPTPVQTCASTTAVPRSEPTRTTVASSASKARKCFVASCAFSNSEAAEVVLLRTYRDNVLVRSGLGRWLIAAYDVVGPWLAERIENRATAKWAVRAAIRNFLLPGVERQLRLVERSQDERMHETTD
jgi:hypothetical protein